ncbi:MAG: thiamine pyrophosphate-binding protein [Gemmatimonadota bacterium]|nr:thiamine pyrophosphate-binding protein [Gemmatimonadota bacterium]
MSMTGAEVLVDGLIGAGVKHLFSLSGNQILSVYDATIGRDIELIHTRHEAAAVHMADGWGRLTEEPGVALLTAGPGHCNGLTALYVALMAESPLLMLSGHCPEAQIGSGAFQEVDQAAAARPVAKASWRVERSDDLEADLTRALELAVSGRPGPVHLSLPTDILEAPARPPQSAPSKGAAEAADENLDGVLALLNSARQPLILAGPAMGRGRRWSAVEALAAATGIPALPMESPRGVNDPALRRAATCLANADVVLLLGKKLDFSLRFGRPPSFSEQSRFIQIDADQSELREHAGVALRLCADPWAAARRLADMARTRSWNSGAWRSDVESLRVDTPADWDGLLRPAASPVHPLGVCDAVQPFLDDGAIFVSDGGEFGQWAQAGLAAEIRLINGPSGAIGSALPMGLAARLAYPDRVVFVLLGDGTFGYHAMELDTALRYGLPVVAIVGNDARWNAEHQLQVTTYGPDRTVGCDLLETRYDRVTEALGGYGAIVDRAEDLPAALNEAVASGLPACVNVAIEPAAAPLFR